MNTKELQNNIDSNFITHFGRTPLGERLENILHEAIELRRFTDMKNLREETGDLLATTIQLCNECGWRMEDIVAETLAKIEKRSLQYKSLGRKINVACLGGAYDPITVGHIKLAQFILNSSKTFDQVFIMPCYQHMYNKSMVSPEHRLAMCKIAANIDSRIHVSDYEIKNQLRGETYHLVKRLLNESFAKDKFDFSMVIGLDNANTFDKWVNSEELERMIRFVVVPRKGIVRDEKVNWYLKYPHIYLSPDNDIPEISSTIIRKCLNTQKYYDSFSLADIEAEEKETKSMRIVHENLDEGVLDYIYEHDLYSGFNIP